jgi:glycerophosphoryl diester phosphodiesterase
MKHTLTKSQHPNYMKLFLSAFFMFGVIFSALNCGSAQNKPSNLDTLDLQGHRGARGLRPENTWPAFQAAIEYKMTTLELDTVLTKDGKVIIHHDSETNPVICQNIDGTEIQKINLYELTLDELKQLDCGSKKNPNFPEQVTFPGTKLITIDEFFKLVADVEKKNGPKAPKYLYNIETKFPNDESSDISEERMKLHVRSLIESIQKAKTTERVTIQSFYLPALSEVESINPKIKRSALFAPTYFQGLMIILGLGNSYRSDIIEKAETIHANIISPYFLYVNSDFVQNSHSKNISVIPWTVNKELEMKRLVSCGVDGIISDYPDRLRKFVDQESLSQAEENK